MTGDKKKREKTNMHIAKIHSTENNKKSSTFLWYCILCCTRGSNFSAGAWAQVLSHSIFLCFHPEGTNLSYLIIFLTCNTVFPQIIAGGNYFFFRTKRGRLSDGGDYLKYCSLEVVPSILCYIFLLNQKNNHVKYTEHGLFSKYSKFISLINFQSLNRH